MNDIDQTEKATAHPHDVTTPKRQLQRQRTSGSPEARPNATGLTAPSTGAVPGAGNSSSLPGHQSGRSKHVAALDQKVMNSTDNLHKINASGDHEFSASNHSPPSSLLRKKNLSTSDLDPLERKKQAALSKVEAKLEKAQRLHQKAKQSVEQEISDFLRVTALPNTNHELNSLRTTNAAFDKRIRTLEDTRKELEKKITTYQSDITRIQAGDIPTTYTSSKDIFSNLKSTAAKVASGSLKHRSAPANEAASVASTGNINEHFAGIHHLEVDHHPNLTVTSPATVSGATNNNQNHLLQTQHSNTLDVAHSSLSSSVSNEIGNSQFYIDAGYDYVFDGEKSGRKHDGNIPVQGRTLDTANSLGSSSSRPLPAVRATTSHPEGLTIHDAEKSPTTKRRLTDESNAESNDRASDHSNDERNPPTTTSKRNTSTTTTAEYQQLTGKIEAMHKTLERNELKSHAMQRQIDLLLTANEMQREQNERLNNELTDLTDIHQIEMLAIKTDLKNLEERLLYKFNDYWSELLEKVEKLDTRTAKVEQTQTHSNEREENTHRIISKLVNILLTVFAIILLLLSTIKNLVQSRIHALTLLILALVWITFHYLPPTYFQTSVFKNFSTMFKRTS